MTLEMSVDKDRLRLLSTALLEAEEARESPFDLEPPEVKFVLATRQIAEELGDDSFPGNALFLTTAMVLGSSTWRLFDRISDTDLLREHAWVFRPEEVAKVVEQNGEGFLLSACFEFFMPAGYPEAVLRQWAYNTSLLKRKYGGDIRNFMEERDFDAVRIVKDLVIRSRATTKEKIAKGGFTRFSDKLARLFTLWANEYEVATIQNLQQIGVPVDYHVANIAIMTGAVLLQRPENIFQISRMLYSSVPEVLIEQGAHPMPLSKAFYFTGSLLCAEDDHARCTLREFCNENPQRRKENYDRIGKFNPAEPKESDEIPS